ncbi:uncharacterized protein ACR2FA_011682 [Aphomia sociella]
MVGLTDATKGQLLPEMTATPKGAADNSNLGLGDRAFKSGNVSVNKSLENAVLNIGTSIRVSTSLANPARAENHSLTRQRRQINFLGNTRLLIEQLIENLRHSAADAIDAVKKFREGISDQVKEQRDKVAANISKLRDRVAQAIQSVSDRFSNSSAAVRECVKSHKGETEIIFNETLKYTMACADQRVKEIGDQLDSLILISNNTSDFANAAMDQMRECLNQNQEFTNILSSGSCLGKVAVQTELKGGVFLAQSSIAISRINLALLTLPAALEVCAGSYLVQAGLATTKIIMEIGSCSASSVFSTMTSAPSS